MSHRGSEAKAACKNDSAKQGLRREELERWLAGLPHLLKPLIDSMPNVARPSHLVALEQGIVESIEAALLHLQVSRDARSNEYEAAVRRDVFASILKLFAKTQDRAAAPPTLPPTETVSSNDRITVRAGKLHATPLGMLSSDSIQVEYEPYPTDGAMDVDGWDLEESGTFVRDASESDVIELSESDYDVDLMRRSG